MDLAGLKAFAAEEHRPFRWPGGRGAALLVHGFPGTPAEVRPLAAALHEGQWTVEGLLLPGFGADIVTLDQRTLADWTAAVERALAALQAGHDSVLLLGYSVGGAVAMAAAAQADPAPAGLALLAPFWRLDSGWQGLIWRVLRPFVRSFQPLRRANLADPRLREMIGRLAPDIDVDDPAVQRDLRDWRVPTRVPDELVAAGRAAGRRASAVRCPVLVVQGTADVIVRPAVTRRLANRLGGPVEYHEVDAGHDLLDPGGPAWPAVRDRVLGFARRVAAR